MKIPLLLFALALLATPSAPAAEPPSALICTRVRIFPTAGAEQATVGGKFEGSNVSRTEGYELLATIKEPPKANDWTEFSVANQRVYRWLRYVGPKPSPEKFGKVEFYAGARLLAGEKQGSAIHAFHNDQENNQFAGYDVFEAATQRPNIKPEPGNQPGPVDVTITGPRGAVIRYTLDGTWPGPDRGEIYATPLHFEKNTTITAVAILPERAASLPVAQSYLIETPAKPSLNTAHLGNSLTGTTSGFWRYARTAGRDHHSIAFLRGGALTRELWALASGEFANDKLASTKEKVARQRGSLPWEEFWAKVGQVDLLTLQPRDFDLEKEINAEINFIKLFRQKSPELQPWLYCEWVELRRERPSDRGEVPSYQMTRTFPALTWEESMGGMLLYVEELQRRLGDQYPEGKRARVLPSALAMGWIKHLIDQGQVPGIAPGSFYPLLFGDQVHPAATPGTGSANGAYLVDMTWYSAFYREAPEGKVLPIETTFTPEQARLVERLAWDVVKNYPDCGLYEEGTPACATPEIVSDGKKITLKSATPGTWFRYTLDGTKPTRTRGYVYCGVITVQPDIHVQAVAYKSGMADSAVAVAP